MYRPNTAEDVIYSVELLGYVLHGRCCCQSETRIRTSWHSRLAVWFKVQCVPGAGSLGLEGRCQASEATLLELAQIHTRSDDMDRLSTYRSQRPAEPQRVICRLGTPGVSVGAMRLGLRLCGFQRTYVSCSENHENCDNPPNKNPRKASRPRGIHTRMFHMFPLRTFMEPEPQQHPDA